MDGYASATSPERAESAATVEEDAAVPLGSRTMALKFVRYASGCVGRFACGGEWAVDRGWRREGINVNVFVSRVAQKCP